MRIAVIGPTYPFRGGIACFTTLLCRALKMRHETRLFSFKKQYPKFLFPGKSDRDPSNSTFREENVIYSISPLNPLTWISTFMKIRDFAPDMVIFQWWVVFWAPCFSALALLLRAFTRTRVLFICHNVKGHEKYPLDTLLTKFTLSKGHGFIVLSSEDAEKLSRMLPGKKIIFHPLPTFSAFDFGSTNSEKARLELGLRGNVALFFGFVRKYKGLEYLLAAMPLVLNEMDLTLLIVGEFWKDKAHYTDIIRRLSLDDKVIIVDRFVNNEDAEKYFKSADVVVLPYSSGTGSGILQMAYGFERPVIATAVGCLRDMVTEDRTGYLVPPCDPQALAAAITKFYRRKDSVLFAENIRQENNKYSWDKLVETIERSF